MNVFIQYLIGFINQYVRHTKNKKLLNFKK